MRAAAVVRHVEARLRTLDIKPHRCCSCDIKSSHRDAMLRKGRKRALPLNSSLPLNSVEMQKVLALRNLRGRSRYREGRKASATAQPLTDGQTDTIYSGSELQSTHGRPTRTTRP